MYSLTIADLFDGMMIVLAMYTMNFIHPGKWMKTPEDDGVLPKDTYTMSSRDAMVTSRT